MHNVVFITADVCKASLKYECNQNVFLTFELAAVQWAPSLLSSDDSISGFQFR